MKKTINIPNISNYIGEVKDDIKNGKGTYSFPPDRYKHIVEFKDGKLVKL